LVYYYNLLYTSDVISLIILGGCKNTEIGKRKSSQISERNLLYFKIRKDYLKFLGAFISKNGHSSPFVDIPKCPRYNAFKSTE